MQVNLSVFTDVRVILFTNVFLKIRSIFIRRAWACFYAR